MAHTSGYLSFTRDVNKDMVWDDNTGVTIKCMLVNDTYSFDAETHQTKSDITGEITGGGYTAGGKEITNRSVILKPEEYASIYEGDDVRWPNSTITTAGAVIYRDTGDASTSELILFIDFEGNKSTDNSEFAIVWSAYGVFVIYV